MNKPLIDQMVDRFLGWKLPADFSPDAGIYFKPIYNEGTPYEKRHEPSGTNLLTGVQAKAMLETVCGDLLKDRAMFFPPEHDGPYDVAHEEAATVTTWQDHLILERAELNERLEKLASYLESKEYLRIVGIDQQVLLWCQHGLMVGYLNILDRRIAAIK